MSISRNRFGIHTKFKGSHMQIFTFVGLAVNKIMSFEYSFVEHFGKLNKN